MRVYLTESQFAKIALTESQESKSISAAKRLLMQQLGYNDDQADKTVRIDIRKRIETLREPAGAKFILGVTRMFANGELVDADVCSKLNNTLKLVSSEAHINEYDRNLNGMSAEELIDRFADVARDASDAKRAEVDKLVFDTPSNYKIVRIDSFEQARQYGQYTEWCVTHYESNYDDYTNEGYCQFYFCLRDGFEYEPREIGKSCPLDSYGLSMIAVCVYPEGDLKTCTCRWNHKNGGDDDIMDEIEVSKVVGVNFYKTFLPNTKQSDEAKKALRLFKKGENPNYVFDYFERDSDLWSVSLFGKYNFINQKYKYISKKWFDYTSHFFEGFSCVEIGEKYNFIDKNGKLLSNKWYNDCNCFSEGFAAVKLGKKWNFIDRNDNYLTKQWFDLCGDFDNGLANVMIDRKWNFIKKNGDYLTKQWYEEIRSFYQGVCPVKLNGKWNFLDTNGNYYLKKWLPYEFCQNFFYGYSIVRDYNGLYNFINMKGELLSPNNWFYDAHNFNEHGFAVVKLIGRPDNEVHRIYRDGHVE